METELESEETSAAFAKRVARASLQRYKVLPNKGKPQSGEWTPLAAVVCKTKNGINTPWCGRG